MPSKVSGGSLFVSDELLSAISTNVLTLYLGKIIFAAADNTCGICLADNNRFSADLELYLGLRLKLECLSNVIWDNDTSQFVNSSFHKELLKINDLLCRYIYIPYRIWRIPCGRKMYLRMVFCVFYTSFIHKYCNIWKI